MLHESPYPHTNRTRSPGIGKGVVDSIVVGLLESVLPHLSRSGPPARSGSSDRPPLLRERLERGKDLREGVPKRHLEVYHDGALFVVIKQFHCDHCTETIIVQRLSFDSAARLQNQLL